MLNTNQNLPTQEKPLELVKRLPVYSKPDSNDDCADEYLDYLSSSTSQGSNAEQDNHNMFPGGHNSVIRKCFTNGKNFYFSSFLFHLFPFYINHHIPPDTHNQS